MADTDKDTDWGRNKHSPPLDTDRVSDEKYWHVARTLRFYNSGRSKITHHDIEKLFTWCKDNDIRSMEPNPNSANWFFTLLEIATPEKLREVCERAKEHGVLPRLQFVVSDMQGSQYKPSKLKS